MGYNDLDNWFTCNGSNELGLLIVDANLTGFPLERTFQVEEDRLIVVTGMRGRGIIPSMFRS